MRRSISDYKSPLVEGQSPKPPVRSQCAWRRKGFGPSHKVKKMSSQVLYLLYTNSQWNIAPPLAPTTTPSGRSARRQRKLETEACSKVLAVPSDAHRAETRNLFSCDAPGDTRRWCSSDFIGRERSSTHSVPLLSVAHEHSESRESMVHNLHA